MNVEHRTSNKCMLSVLKKISRSDSIIRHSSCVIPCSFIRVVTYMVHVGLALNPCIFQRRSQLNSSLKPYWGKPDVRNFRGGAGNVMRGYVACARLLSTRRPNKNLKSNPFHYKLSETDMMKVCTTELDGVLIIEPDVFKD